MYNIVFITHLPAFYKINLYKEISKKKKICVLFISSGSSIRTPDFSNKEIPFEHYIITTGDFEDRNPLHSLVMFYRRLRSIESDQFVVGGWDLPEFWLTIFMKKKRNNAVVVESTVLESDLSFHKRWLKKLFLNRVSCAYVCGKLHKELLVKVGFNGRMIVTKGVGLFNRDIGGRSFPLQGYSKRLLYLGRLSEEKNIEALVHVMRHFPEATLSIVGEGPLRQKLISQSGDNVSFLGHVVNNEIAKIYTSHDIFILPSLKEPWGLAVEEAIFFGLPVVVSNRVGCHSELVVDKENGIVFDVYKDSGLLDALQWIICKENYNLVKHAVGGIDLLKKDVDQINSYTDQAQKTT